MSEDVKPYIAGAARDGNAAARLTELRSLTMKLDLSQRGVARELEVDERTVRYWFSGQYPTPISAIYALRYLAEMKARANPAHSGQDAANALSAYTRENRNALAAALSARATEAENCLSGNSPAREEVANALAKSRDAVNVLGRGTAAPSGKPNKPGSR